MSTCEMKPECGDTPDPVAEAKTAVTDFLGEFKAFRNDFQQKLQEQDNRMRRMEHASTAPVRPVLSAQAGSAAPYRKAFDAYLRSGDDDGLKTLELEGKALNTVVAGDGGYLVDPQTSETIRSVLSLAASVRAIASVVEVEATSYDLLIDHSDVGHGWTTESGSVSETGTPSIDRISIPLHELSALPKASQRLLDDSAFDIETWLAGRIADKFARAEADAFINGDGVDKPTGILTHPAVDNEAWSWGNLGYVPTGADGDFGGPDAIMDLVYAVGARYRANGSFVMNSRTASAVRKMKDSDGRFLWSDGLSAGEPSRLLGYRVLIAEDMPDMASDATALAFGDFAAGYTVAERPDLRILRDPFSAKPHVLFYATKRIGGDVSDFAAIKLLKFSVS